jgi:hypothetical protein
MDQYKNPYQDQPVPTEPNAIGRWMQGVIALLFAVLAIYLVS